MTDPARRPRGRQAMNECSHDADAHCQHCTPTPVKDGRELVEDFQKRHHLKSLEHARALMQIESYRPVPKP